MDKRKRNLVELEEYNHDYLRTVAFKERSSIRKIVNHCISKWIEEQKKINGGF